ncbi:hypothetical protein [Methyloceanibacter caenitepidi]|uniref:Uncharacterized protein n=1 Tax=Methyloceanibacter caenitepidi TaxID=1384459 RepID=A0A0A8K6D6_9HYPH|nr:hypothetical protein [Methyloceanibacter caenitepidi]BAQ18331.1 hypothetical protein GL4_2898 [Methyloceanibacter caenitepidi]
MTDQTETDDPILLERDAWAMVWSPDEGWRLLMPATVAEAPDEALALLGAFFRLAEDAAFRDECAEHALEEHDCDNGDTVH